MLNCEHCVGRWGYFKKLARVSGALHNAESRLCMKDGAEKQTPQILRYGISIVFILYRNGDNLSDTQHVFYTSQHSEGISV